mmetsp:Transcript_17365/g.21233  ORF Transcript_17365/g.21233 Transcript_17365/m.21233 type:complete len:374 (+) Transcript_17365:76-1197(+)
MMMNRSTFFSIKFLVQSFFIQTLFLLHYHSFHSIKVAMASTAPKSTTHTTIKDILSRVQRWQNIHYQCHSNLPFVCVTYAQTIDGMIAIRKKTTTENNNNKDNYININNNDGDNQQQCLNKVSSNLKLSCDDSMQFTHALRSIHDGILVGGNTLMTDNPRLNNRLWKSNNNKDDTDDNCIESKSSFHQPTPVILDTNLKHIMQMMNSQTNIRTLGSHEKIIICCSHEAFDNHNEEIQNTFENNVIQLLPCQQNEIMNEKGTRLRRMDLRDVLHNLHITCGIKSLMVEGGSSILSSFIQCASDIVDCACVTIVPKMLGGVNGLCGLEGCDLVQSNDDDDESQAGIEFDPLNSVWTTIGSDCIFLGVCPLKSGIV